MNEDDVARLWDENAATWASHVRAGFDVFRDEYNNPAFLAFLGSVAGLDLLDAGCGEGTNTRILAGRGARMVGVDLSTEMLANARAAESEARLGIRYEATSFTKLDGVEDACFDVVVSTMALMDGPDLPGALRAFHRVLRPCGRLVFSIAHPCFTNAALGWETVEGVQVLRLRGYAVDKPEIESWRFGAAPEETPPFRIAYFPRTISEVVNAVIAAGFRLTAVAEPCATEEACGRHPRLSRHRGIPHFFYVGAQK